MEIYTSEEDDDEYYKHSATSKFNKCNKIPETNSWFDIV